MYVIISSPERVTVLKFYPGKKYHTVLRINCFETFSKIVDLKHYIKQDIIQHTIVSLTL